MNLTRKTLTLAFAVLLLTGFLQAQILEPVKWSFAQQLADGQEYHLVFTAKMDKGWHLYSQYVKEGGPIPTTFHFEPSNDFKLIGKVTEPKALSKYDKSFEMDVLYFDNKVEFKQKIRALTDRPFTVKGYLEFMTCDDEKCLPPAEVDFSFTIAPGGGSVAKTDSPAGSGEKAENQSVSSGLVDPLVLPASAETDPVDSTAETANDNSEQESDLWTFFWLAFLGGLVAILTPCVFPMIPMTVSFFMHDKGSKAKIRMQATFYGISIIAIYTVIGTVVALTLGANFANWLSTHWVPNVFFFLVFMFFAAAFFGAFELTLPSWIVNKADQQADKGGFMGSFFMAFTLVLVSFSCTAPIVGSILVASASGEILKPVIGMIGFGLAFALPFTLFALFPGWLSTLPKSGGWLNSVKVVLGFIEVALGLKFLSVADQTYHWGLLDREIYIAIWIVVFALMGFYLLGKIKFKHDSEVKYVGVFRLSLVIATFSFVVYLIPGMWGAPLKFLAGYLPPQASHDFDLNQVIRDNAKMVMTGANFQGSTANGEECEKPKYADFLHLPHGLEGFFDYEQGLECAKKLNKPVFIDFTGHGCVNCREMEARVWSNPEVLRRLKNDFIIIALYVDDKTTLPEKDWIVSSYDGKVKKTIGKKYADFQISRFNVNAQPYYVILDTDANMLVPPKAYDLNIDNFIKFLDSGLEAFRNKN